MTLSLQKIMAEYAASCRRVAAEWLNIAGVTEGDVKHFAQQRAAHNHAEAQRVEAELCATKPEPGCQVGSKSGPDRHLEESTANPDNLPQPATL